MQRLKFALTGLALCAGIASAADKGSAPPDLILAHGTPLTVDLHDTVAQALAVKNGVIIRVGSDAEVLPLAGPHTRMIDLHGRTATPGLLDSHAHMAEGGLGEVTSLQLGEAASVA